jgi:hypothetical protein
MKFIFKAEATDVNVINVKGKRKIKKEKNS